MSFPFLIAKKYLSSKYGSNFLSFVSVFSIIGIALGVAILIIALTILDGFEKTVEQKIIGFNSHIKISAFSKHNLTYSEPVIDSIKSVCKNDLISISTYFEKQAIIKSKKLSEGIIVTGINPENDNSQIKNYIIKGKYSFIENGSPTVIIGQKLARKLFIDVGDKITLFTLFNDKMPTMENPPSIEQYIVSGIYESGMAEYDDLLLYMNMSDAQNLFGLPNVISGYNVKLKRIENLENYVKNLQAKLRYPHYVRSIFKVHQNIFTWLNLQKEPIPIVLGLIIIVAVFNIIGTLLIMILERVKNIGILKTLGAKNSQIIKIFLFQGIFITGVGIILGCLLSFILSYLQLEFGLISLPDEVYFLNKVPISITFINYLIVGGSAFILSIIASLIPSYYATKINIVDSIKFE